MAPKEPQIYVRVVDVYPYRRATDEPEFLLLRRSADAAYAGQWRMVGGKIEPGEAAWQAALRELREETGLAPAALWSVPSANVFYEWRREGKLKIPYYFHPRQAGGIAFAAVGLTVAVGIVVNHMVLLG